MQSSLYELMLASQQKQELERIISSNEKTEQFGLRLTQEDARMLVVSRKDTLRQERRVEFGEGILPKLIEVFCDSPYLNQVEYRDTLIALQELFYLYKNESMDNLTDDELMTFMKEQFDGVCFGSVEYLGETCLERFSRAIRAGYCGYAASAGKGEYEKFSEEMRWDRDLYLEAVAEFIQ